MQTPRAIDFKSLLWWLVVAIQLLTGSYFRSIPASFSQRADIERLISSNYDMVFEFNIIFGSIFLLNFLLQRYILVVDSTYYYIGRFNLMIQFQYRVDVLCGVIAVIYTSFHLSIFLQVYFLV